MTFPFALIQSIGMVFFINSLMAGIIDTTSWATVFFAAFVMAVGAMTVSYTHLDVYKRQPLHDNAIY